MPIFELVIKKGIDNEDWTNVYHLNLADIATAKAQADLIVPIEKAVHYGTVTFKSYRLTQAGTRYTNYASIPLTGTGVLNPGEDALPLPLFNTVKVLFQPNNFGKPDYKQLRLPLYTDELLDIDHITSTKAAYIVANYINDLLEIDGICDSQGNSWVSGTVDLKIHDRQLTKRRRRPLTV